MQQSTQDIAARAYQLWEEEGRPHGRDLDHWERAASELSTNGNGNGNGHSAAAAVDELTVVAKPAKKAKAATVDVAVPAKPKRKSPSKAK